MTDPIEIIEIIARAISVARNLSPDSLYQHNDYEDWPEDHRNEYVCVITGKPMVAVFHKAWRRHEAAALAAIAALTEAGFAIVPVEPTLEMSSAGLEAIIDLHCGEAPAAYRAMIEAGKVTA